MPEICISLYNKVTGVSGLVWQSNRIDGEGRPRGQVRKDAGRLSPRGNAEKSPLVGSLGSFNISPSISIVVFWFLLCSHLLVYHSALELSVIQESLCGIWGKGGPGTLSQESCLGPEMVGNTAIALNDQGWMWMKNPHLPAPLLLARKIEEGSLGISRKGDCVLCNIESHVV